MKDVIECLRKAYALDIVKHHPQWQWNYIAEENVKEWTPVFEIFATLVRNSALEEAAKVCDELAEQNREAMTDSMWQQGECAAAIRTRKEPTP